MKFLLIFAILGVVLFTPAFAQAGQITMTTDKQSYGTDDIIKISGTLLSPGASNSAILQVYSPSNILIQVGTFTISPDGKYSTTVKAEGASWNTDGSYTIKVLYVSPPVTAITSQSISFKVVQSSAQAPQSSQTTQATQTNPESNQDNSSLEKQIQDRITIANRLKENLNQNSTQASSPDNLFWVKVAARHWHDGTIDNTQFGKSIQYMESIGLVKTDAINSPQQIPDWVKNVAGWWAEDAIQDGDYINLIQFLLEDKIIK